MSARPGPVWTIVVAAGSGSRFGGEKQYRQVAGQRVLDWSLRAARSASDGVVLVVPAHRVDSPEPLADLVVAGGGTRSASVRAGLAAVPAEAEIVCVHDAVRPWAGPALFDRVIAAVADGADCAVPGLAVVDTVKRSDQEREVVETLERDGLVTVQTPQAFAAARLRAAHAEGSSATDDAGLVEAIGGRVVVVDGEASNAKITNPEDLEVRTTGGGSGGLNIRIGNGFDVHRFSEDPHRPLMLGGVVFEGEPGLEGHSDADAVTHAVGDALLAAAGLGDIGTHFPDTDPTYGGADSIDLLIRVVEMVESAGWRPLSVDCTVVAERPKIAPRRDEMCDRLSAVVGVPVGVKGTTAEQLGAIGRGEGVACWVVALVERVQR